MDVLNLISSIVHSPVTTMISTIAMLMAGAAVAMSNGELSIKALPAVICGAVLLAAPIFIPETKGLPTDPEANKRFVDALSGGAVVLILTVLAGLATAAAVLMAGKHRARRWPIGRPREFRTGFIEPVVPQELAVSLSTEDLARWISDNTRWFVEARRGRWHRWERLSETHPNQVAAIAAIESLQAQWQAQHSQALAALKKPPRPQPPREVLSKKVFRQTHEE